MSTIRIEIKLEASTKEALARLASAIEDEITRLMEDHYILCDVEDGYELTIDPRYAGVTAVTKS